MPVGCLDLPGNHFHKASQRIVHRVVIGKVLGNVRVDYHHVAAFLKASSVFPAHATAEVVFFHQVRIILHLFHRIVVPPRCQPHADHPDSFSTLRMDDYKSTSTSRLSDYDEAFFVLGMQWVLNGSRQRIFKNGARLFKRDVVNRRIGFRLGRVPFEIKSHITSTSSRIAQFAASENVQEVSLLPPRENNQRSALYRLRIAVDAGHGTPNSGARGPTVSATWPRNGDCSRAGGSSGNPWYASIPLCYARQ